MPKKEESTQATEMKPTVAAPKRESTVTLTNSESTAPRPAVTRQKTKDELFQEAVALLKIK
jgi:hypothetical protein